MTKKKGERSPESGAVSELVFSSLGSLRGYCFSRCPFGCAVLDVVRNKILEEKGTSTRDQPPG